MQTSILLVTLALMALSGAVMLRVLRAKDGPSPPPSVNKQRSRFIWCLVILGVLVSLASLRDWPHRSAGSDAMIVNITSGQWWWETDTVEIPLGQQVEFRVTTEDVNHGLGIYDPDLNLVAQVQAMPNYTNKLVHTFEVPGTYQILCMEFCGISHHDMINEFDVLEESK